MANPWSIPATGWVFIVASWWFSPVINFYLQKLFAHLDFDAPKELRELEFHTVPALKATLRVVEEKRMIGAARYGLTRSDLDRLDKLDMHLKSALYEAEDILDRVDYYRIEKKVTGVDRTSWSWAMQQGIYGVGACIACWMGILMQQCINITPAPLLQFVQSLKLQLGQFFEGTMSQWRSSALLPVSRVASTVGFQRLYGWCGQVVTNITSICWSLLSWCSDWTAAARYFRDWSNEQFGINSNQQNDDGNVPTIERIRLRKQINGITDLLNSSKKLDLLNQNSSAPNGADNESSSSTHKETDDLYRNIEQEVFGREEDRAHISRMLREGPGTYAASSSTSNPNSVIVIYGITGSGKSTLAQYVCEYEKDAGHFDPIMFIHVGKTFSVGDIFRDILDKITKQRPSDSNDLKSLKTELKDIKAKLKEELKGKRFLLVLDDVLAVPIKSDHIKQRWILLDVLSVGQSGSRILVTAQNKDAAAGLGSQQQISIRDLEEHEYLSMFMHYAQVSHVTNTDFERYKEIGRKIIQKLRTSPIAGRTVAARLQTNNSIDDWQRTANDDVLNETMGALWWSYQQLGADIRQCFAYCSTFPRGYVLERDELVRMWIAQGFVNTCSNETKKLAVVGHRYFNELLTFSFLQVQRRTLGQEPVEFTIHDLLHDLAERVSGTEFFRIGLNDGSPKDIPRGVRHLFIETRNVAEIIEKILDMENLRTLVIIKMVVTMHDMEDILAKDFSPSALNGIGSNGSPKDVAKINEKILDLGNSRTLINNEDSFDGPKSKRNHDLENVLGRLFMRLKKLRVLIIKLKYYTEKELSVPASIDHMKHLRYICFHFHGGPFNLKLPSTFSKLYHMQAIDIPCFEASGPEDMANLIYLQHISAPLCFPNIGRLMSLQTLKQFRVKEEQGYGLKQLKHLNKLRGSLSIEELGIVRSKEEALEAQLTHKERLRRLKLHFGWGKRLGPDVEAKVLEGLCPPKDLHELRIEVYMSSCYPSWMLSRNHPDAPKQLHRLELYFCSQLASIPEGSELFIGLRELCISSYYWDRLPENMEHLLSLQRLEFWSCKRMELLPTLPQALKDIVISECDMLRSIGIMDCSRHEFIWENEKRLEACTSLEYCQDTAPTGTPEQSPYLMICCPCLVTLEISHCAKLVTLPYLPPSLKRLSIIDCGELCSVSGQLGGLDELYISGCNKLQSVDSLGYASSLETLSLLSCQYLASLGSCSGPGSYLALRQLRIEDCPAMDMMQFNKNVNKNVLDGDKKLLQALDELSLYLENDILVQQSGKKQPTSPNPNAYASLTSD